MKRNRTQSTCLALSLSALAGLASAPAARAQSYGVTDLGTLTPGYASYGLSINNANTVVGYAYVNSSQNAHGFVSKDGTLSDIGTLGGTTSVAYRVNSSGQFTGYSSNTAGLYQAYYDDGTTMNNLGTLPGQIYSLGEGINAGGQVAGYSGTGTQPAHAFLSAPNGGALSDLGTLGGPGSYAYGVNDAGTVVGWSNPAGSSSLVAFTYANGVMTNMGTLGGTQSLARDINNAGMVVGNSYVVNGNTHGFVYANSTMTDLGTLGGTTSNAWSLNKSGQIVGYASNAAGATRAFLDNGTTMTDLNSLISPTSGWTLTTAYDISDNGFITGYGTINGQTHAFLLTPSATPEPSSVVVLSLGLLSLGGLALRARRVSLTQRKGTIS